MHKERLRADTSAPVPCAVDCARGLGASSQKAAVAARVRRNAPGRLHNDRDDAGAQAGQCVDVLPILLLDPAFAGAVVKRALVLEALPLAAKDEEPVLLLCVAKAKEVADTCRLPPPPRASRGLRSGWPWWARRT